MTTKKTLKKRWYKDIIKTIQIKKKTENAINFLSDFFELPRELTSKITKITMIENEKLLIEGYKQILDYYDNYIKIRTYTKDIVIDGSLLDIKEITDQDLIIEGNIISLNYKVD